MTQWPRQSAAKDFYGNNVRVVKGVPGPDPKWEKENLVIVALPWKAWAAWDQGVKVKGFRVHSKCAESLARILGAVWKAFGQNQKAIEAAHLHLIGGGYCWRARRGSAQLSMHALGCAVDLDPAHNGFGDPTPEIDARVVSAFKAEGWAWGGDWSPQHRDGMHFQAATV